MDQHMAKGSALHLKQARSPPKLVCSKPLGCSMKKAIMGGRIDGVASGSLLAVAAHLQPSDHLDGRVASIVKCLGESSSPLGESSPSLFQVGE